MSKTADGGGRTVVVIGEGDLSDEVATALESAGAGVERLLQPDEDEVRKALEGRAVDSVAVVAREDAFVLRMALIVRSVSEEVPLFADDLRPDDGGAGRRRGAEHAGDLARRHHRALGAAAVSVEGDSPILLIDEDGELSEEPVPQLKAHRFEALARACSRPTTRAPACFSTARSDSWRSS